MGYLHARHHLQRRHAVTGSGDILVVNAGSSSIKLAVFSHDLAQRISGLAEGIGTTPRLGLGGQELSAGFSDHPAALKAMLSALDAAGYPLSGLRAAAHRVVHGGDTLTAPVPVTPQVIARIDACAALAPLHNPHNLGAIRTLAELAPDLPQFASFDTAFHSTNPAVAVRYAIPQTPETQDIRRYGFHGLSYAALVRALPRLSSAPLPARLLAFHLGNGASICAIRDGASVATTMGYSPLEGLTMGTRAGSIDANAVLRMVAEAGPARTSALLNTEGGLRGLSGGLSDMRALLESDAPGAGFAVAHFCYWARRHAGSMIAAMEGVDAIAFTGGIGENAAPVRARILQGLGWAGVQFDPAANDSDGPRLHLPGASVPCWIVPAQEERMIAADAQTMLAGPDASASSADTVSLPDF